MSSSRTMVVCIKVIWFPATYTGCNGLGSGLGSNVERGFDGMGILCVFCVYDTIGNRCFEKTSFPKRIEWHIKPTHILIPRLQNQWCRTAWTHMQAGLHLCCFFVVCWFFFKIHFFEKFLQEYYLSGPFQTDRIQIRPDILLRLIWVQSICKSYQQVTPGLKVLKLEYSLRPRRQRVHQAPAVPGKHDRQWQPRLVIWWPTGQQAY